MDGWMGSSGTGGLRKRKRATITPSTVVVPDDSVVVAVSVSDLIQLYLSQLADGLSHHSFQVCYSDGY